MILLQQKELMQMLSEATAIAFALSPSRRSSTRFARIFTAVKIAETLHFGASAVGWSPGSDDGRLERGNT
jgi:hypothetical protein